MGFAKAKRKRLMWMLGVSVAAGVAAELFADVHREIQFLGAIGIIVAVGSWCNVDARERDYTIGKGQFAAIVLFPIVGLPVYFIRTRGIRGILSILLALLFYSGMIALQIIAMEVTHLIT
jgi:hypothetical protein